MTQNTIDLAIATSILNSPSDTASPGNTGICGGKPSFGKSLQEAMQTTDVNDEMVGCDAEQFLPPAGQELPLHSAYKVGLEGITEVRALADAISSITRGTDQLTQQANNGLDISVVTSVVAGGPQTAAANELRSASGVDPSNSEEANFDLRQKIDAPSGNPNENINRQMGSLKGPLSSGLNETRITLSDAVLITETTNSKENAGRSLSLDPGLGLSSITQAESKSVNRANAIQVPQQPLMTKSPEVVSSNELATHLRVLKSSGGGEARLQLHPAELGRMTVSLITEGDEARVSFVVDNPQAKQAVEVSLPRLRDLMDEAGLSLTDADVSDRHAKENEDQSVEQVMEETTANSGSDAEDSDEFTPPTSAQLVDTFV
ncbi:MAG: flagellar hook-length control protein FliK [Luminiphilus sp.]